MSQDTPDKSELMRSNIITLVFTVIFLVLVVLFWMWSAPDVVDTSPVGALNDINPYVTFVIEILVLFGVFVFGTVTVVNFRLQLTDVRAGWPEIILMIIVVAVIAYLAFGVNAMGGAVVLSLGFVAYLYLLQE
ncbi:MAG TPA: hypothetical protein ENG31_01435 [Candidatus Thorarchaeota archaeon]|nr:hypothetical protein [Candidatus Thorarchaeota archaeon]